MILIKNFNLSIDKFKLNNINLLIASNDIFAILGKTGSGKTMLLESIAGFYQGDTGTVYIHGTDVVTIKPESRQIGFVYQDFGLFPHMTVYENIRYGLRMHRVDKKKCDNVINEIIQILKIEHVINQYPGTLSGGERQRTAIARVLVLNPRIILMDEPFSALDPNTREQMYELIENIHSKYGCTIVFVTHNFYEAQRIAKRIGIMVNGELRTICKAEDLFNQKDDWEITEFLGGNYYDSKSSVSKVNGWI